MIQLVLGLVLVVVTAGAAWSGGNADAGKTLYEKKCMTCHSIGGHGGPMAKIGGPLDDVGSKQDEAWLLAYITEPKSKMPDSKMPKLKLTETELNDVVAYLLTLKGPAPAK